MSKRHLLVLLTFALAGCATALPDQAVGPFKADPAVTASVSVNGSDVTVKLASQNFKVIPASQATSAHLYGEGHYHLFLDVAPTAPGEVIPNTNGVYHTADSSYVIHGVTTGHHVLWVVLGFSDHTPYQQTQVSSAGVKGTMTKVVFDVGNGAVAQAPSAEPSATAAASSAPSVAPSTAASAPSGPVALKVSVLGDPSNGGKYDPASQNVKVGDTVQWDWNDDSASHSVTDDGGAFDSAVQAKGFTFTFTYKTAGTFGYSCTVHPNMKGSITVQ